MCVHVCVHQVLHFPGIQCCQAAPSRDNDALCPHPRLLQSLQPPGYLPHRGHQPQELAHGHTSIPSVGGWGRLVWAGVVGFFYIFV